MNLLEYWTHEEIVRMRAVLDAKLLELETLPDLKGATDAIITLAGATPSSETRRVSILSAIVMHMGGPSTCPRTHR